MVPDEIDPHQCINKNLTIDFSAGYTRADFETTISALSAGTINAEPMITDVVSLDRCPGCSIGCINPTAPPR